MNQLSLFFERFSLAAKMFYSGRLCGISSDHESEQAGHLHVFKKGTPKIIRPNARVDTDNSFRNALQSLIDHKLLPPAAK